MWFFEGRLRQPLLRWPTEFGVLKFRRTRTLSKQVNFWFFWLTEQTKSTGKIFRTLCPPHCSTYNVLQNSLTVWLIIAIRSTGEKSNKVFVRVYVCAWRTTESSESYRLHEFVYSQWFMSAAHTRTHIKPRKTNQSNRISLNFTQKLQQQIRYSVSL